MPRREIHEANRALAAFSPVLAFGALFLFGVAEACAQSVRCVATWSVPPLKKDSQPILDSIHFSPDGKTLAVSVALGDRLQRYFVAYDVATRKETLRFELVNRCNHFLYTQDGKTLVTKITRSRDYTAKEAGAGSYHVIDFRDPKTGKVRHSVRLSGRHAWTMHATPDSKTLVCWGPGHVLLIDLATGRASDRFPAAVAGYSGKTALSPDGKLLAVLDGLLKLSVYDLPEGKLLSSAESVKDLKSPNGGPAFTPDGKSVTYVDGDGEAFTYDVATGRLLIKREVNLRNLYALGYTKSGEALVGADADRGGGACLFSFRQDKRVVDKNNGRFGGSMGAVTPDGRKVAIGQGTGGAIRLFEVDPDKD